MAKWADYLISEVKFNATGTHIDEVKAHKDSETSAGPAEPMSRQTVINKIEAGTTFGSVFDNGSGGWRFGAYVKIVVINGSKYLKTYNDGTTRDNLDNLPRY